MSRIKRGWELTKRSWGVLRENRELFRFPIYGALSVLVVTAVTVLPGLYLIDTKDSTPGGIALLAVGIYITAFVGTYFAVGLAACADALFHGRETSVSDGLAVARSHLGAIAGWALLSAIVGVIIAAIESLGRGGQIIGMLGGAAWSLVTFLAVPVIALEGTGPIETVKRSAHLFRSRWVGQVTGNVAIGGIVVLVGILPAIAIGAVGVLLWTSNGGGTELAGGAVLVAIAVVIFAISALIIQAMRGVFGVALYRFAADGTAAGPFSDEDLQSAVRSKDGAAPVPAA